tara:strand:- start:380 stop:490 length:111 start_codon:yes stop_codon:yes gene_type:complete
MAKGMNQKKDKKKAKKKKLPFSVVAAGRSMYDASLH